MAFQDQSNAYIAYKAQTALGAKATGTGAKILRTSGGSGGALTKATAASDEVRRDAMRTRGRHGTQRSSGSYTAELSSGSFDDILEAVMRGTWAAAITVSSAQIPSITTTASTIIAVSGSWITLGLRVGDVIKLTTTSTPTNNNKFLRIIGLTATVITVAETLTVAATADTTYSVVRSGRKLIQPAAPIKRYFTIEEYEADIDSSEVFQDAMFGSLKLSMAPNGMLSADIGWTGTGAFETLTGASAPMFTTPVASTALPMAVADATLRIGGSDLIDLTSFDVSFELGLTAPDVAAGKVAPDIFTAPMAVTINFTTLRQDVSRVAQLLNETRGDLLLLAWDDSKTNFFALNANNFTLGGVTKSALAAAGGARTVQVSVPSDLVGIDDRGGAYDPTMVSIQISNVS